MIISGASGTWGFQNHCHKIIATTSVLTFASSSSEGDLTSLMWR
jgi:hypothetical protein